MQKYLIIIKKHLNYMESVKGLVVKKICCKIERLRNEMHRVALEKGISHPDVLVISQMLDQVMNELDKDAKKHESTNPNSICSTGRLYT